MRLLTILTVLLTLPAAAFASAETTRERSSAEGDYAITQTSATVKRPRVIRLVVTSSPSQQATVTWSILCSRGYGSSSKSGQVTVGLPFRKALQHPMLRRADSCIVSANAQLDEGGRITVAIRAARR